MKMVFSKKFLFLCFDLLLIVIVITGVSYVLSMKELWRKPGFFCMDLKYSMPHKGDTVDMANLMKGTAFTPLLWIVIVEITQSRAVGTLFERVIKVILKSLDVIKCYVFGYTLHLVPLLIFKMLFPEPRPDFFDTCKPDALATCKAGEYVDEWSCTSTNKALESEGTRSFPSGHSGLAFFYSMFFVFYIQARIIRQTKRPNSVFLYSMIQICFVTFAFFVSTSRVVDNRHHWWDALTGSIFGILMAYYTIYTICNGFVKRPPSTSERPKRFDYEIPEAQIKNTLIPDTQLV